jgi:hypothetical protein
LAKSCQKEREGKKCGVKVDRGFIYKKITISPNIVGAAEWDQHLAP